MKVIKSIACAILLIVALSSCKVYAPEYKRVENFAYNKLDRDGFKLTGDLIFYNPNKFGFKLHELLMDVQIDVKHMATAGRIDPVIINRGSEFTIPLDLTVKPDMSLTDGIKALITIFQTRSVGITIEGTVIVKAFGMKVPVEVRQNEKIDLTRLR